MTDDDDTLRKRPERATTSTERRGKRLAPAPPIDDIEEITSPIDILDGDLSPDDLEIVKHSRRNSDDPATYGDLVKLTRRQHERERSEQATNREIKKLLGRLESAEKVEARLKKIESLVDWGKRIAAGLAAFVLSGAGYTLTKLQDRAELQGETTIRLKHIEETLARLVDRDERRYTHSPADRDWPIPPFPTTKDKP